MRLRRKGFHDIETSWLIDRGTEVLGDPAYREKLLPITGEIAENIYNTAYKNHSLMNECERGVDDTTRVWWVQAEAVVGFLNAWQKKPEETKYLDAAKDIWGYIKEYVIDKREGSEWFWCVNADGSPIHEPIFLLSRFENKRQEEIAEIMGITIHTELK